LNEPIHIFILSTGFAFILSSVVWFYFDLRRTKKLLNKADSEKNALQTIISDAEMMVCELNNFSNYLLEKIERKNYETGHYLEMLDESLNNVKLSVTAARKIKSRPLGLSKRKFAGGWRSANGAGANVAGAPGSAAHDDAGRGGDAHGGAGRGVFDGIAVTSPAETPRQSGTQPAGRRPEGRRYKSRYLKRLININAAAAGGLSAPLISFEADAGNAGNVKKGGRRLIPSVRGRKFLEVMRHYEEGMDEADIARTMGIGRGEVALIIGLGKRSLINK